MKPEACLHSLWSGQAPQQLWKSAANYRGVSHGPALRGLPFCARPRRIFGTLIVGSLLLTQFVLVWVSGEQTGATTEVSTDSDAERQRQWCIA